jgi:hypothetical protein
MSPCVNRPDATAAVEAGNIARRYDFDFVYVVDLWADIVYSPARIDSSKQPMMGRLLLSHGLHHAPSPLRLSSLVHRRILSCDGWVEYRHPEAGPLDFTLGYSCAFYSSQYSPSTWSVMNSPISGVHLSTPIDRGLVFAAFRKPKGNDKLGQTFNNEQLRDLHRDAEVLVEMLIDVHSATLMS